MANPLKAVAPPPAPVDDEDERWRRIEEAYDNAPPWEDPPPGAVEAIGLAMRKVDEELAKGDVVFTPHAVVIAELAERARRAPSE